MHQLAGDADPRVSVDGDFGDPLMVAQALEHPADGVFHLANVPSSLAERGEQALG
jgi:hypothetical protein